MNELHKAYNALGLEPGAPFETVKRRYRRLVLVWHPDRMTNADAKREAEEELKRINNSFEKLKRHFESEHKSGSNCRFQPAAAGPPPPGSQNTSSGSRGNTKSSGPTAEQRRQEEEATRKRNAERERKAAEEAAARRAAEAAQNANEKQQAAEDAIKSEAARKEEVLRWKCAAAVAATFILLIAYCWIGCAARDLTYWTGKQWENFQDQFKPKPQAPPPSGSPSFAPEQPSQPYEPYIPPYERFPGENPTSWRQFHDEQEQRRKAEEKKQRQQDIYFAKLQIDRAQKAIDHCSHDIAQMELKLLDPYISEFEKNKIREMRDFQQRNLAAAQSELQDAERKLKGLEPTSPFGPPQEPPVTN